MNKLVLNQFQQLELIFLLLTLHLGLSQSGRLSISINITESSGICINVLLTSWQSFGTRSWDLRSKGKKDCIIPYTGWIVRSCQVKPQVSFPTAKIWDKIPTHKQVHTSDNFAKSLWLAPGLWQSTLMTLEWAVLLLFNGWGTQTRAGGAEVQNILQSF